MFFDLDHTLWDFDRNSGLTFSKILAENDMAVPLDAFLEVYVPLNLEYWKQYRENRITKDELRYLRLRKTFDKLQVDITDALIHLLAERYIEELTSFSHLLPDAREALDYLHPRYRLHIITNGFHEVQDRKLRNSGIHTYFTQVINSEMAGVKKPDPYIFRLALERAGTTPEKSLMIGDNLEADILGARAVGLHTLHLNLHNEPAPGLGAAITGLREIKSYL